MAVNRAVRIRTKLLPVAMAAANHFDEKIRARVQALGGVVNSGGLGFRASDRASDTAGFSYGSASPAGVEDPDCYRWLRLVRHFDRKHALLAHKIPAVSAYMDAEGNVWPVFYGVPGTEPLKVEIPK